MTLTQTGFDAARALGYEDALADLGASNVKVTRASLRFDLGDRSFSVLADPAYEYRGRFRVLMLRQRQTVADVRGVWSDDLETAVSQLRAM